MTIKHVETCSPVEFSATRGDFVHRLTVTLRNAWTAYLNRRAVRQLTAFDEHMLRDIGLTQADVDFAIQASRWGDPSQHLAEMAAARRGSRRRRAR